MRKSYATALDEALNPFGFVRSGSDWFRMRGDIQHRVHLHRSWLGGVTVELFSHDLETEKLFLKVMAGDALQMPNDCVRIGKLIDGFDVWWGKDEQPEDLAEKAVRYCLPWFDKVQTLEEQAAVWYQRDNPRAWHVWTLMKLALTLYRMGEVEEACRALRRPAPKLASPAHVALIERTIEWLGCDLSGPGAGAKS